VRRLIQAGNLSPAMIRELQRRVDNPESANVKAEGHNPLHPAELEYIMRELPYLETPLMEFAPLPQEPLPGSNTRVGLAGSREPGGGTFPGAALHPELQESHSMPNLPGPPTSLQPVHANFLSTPARHPNLFLDPIPNSLPAKLPTGRTHDAGERADAASTQHDASHTASDDDSEPFTPLASSPPPLHSTQASVIAGQGLSESLPAPRAHLATPKEHQSMNASAPLNARARAGHVGSMSENLRCLAARKYPPANDSDAPIYVMPQQSAPARSGSEAATTSSVRRPEQPPLGYHFAVPTKKGKKRAPGHAEAPHQQVTGAARSTERGAARRPTHAHPSPREVWAALRGSWQGGLGSDKTEPAGVGGDGPLEDPMVPFDFHQACNGYKWYEARVCWDTEAATLNTEANEVNPDVMRMFYKKVPQKGGGPKKNPGMLEDAAYYGMDINKLLGAYTPISYDKMRELKELGTWASHMRPMSVHDIRPLLILCQSLLNDIIQGKLETHLQELSDLKHSYLRLERRTAADRHDAAIFRQLRANAQEQMMRPPASTFVDKQVFHHAAQAAIREVGRTPWSTIHTAKEHFPEPVPPAYQIEIAHLKRDIEELKCEAEERETAAETQQQDMREMADEMRRMHAEMQQQTDQMFELRGVMREDNPLAYALRDKPRLLAKISVRGVLEGLTSDSFMDALSNPHFVDALSDRNALTAFMSIAPAYADNTSAASHSMEMNKWSQENPENPPPMSMVDRIEDRATKMFAVYESERQVAEAEISGTQ
ncbi:hypothetical protein CYMTET_56780, partial [Cymbomonas tetramitiformis]